MTIQEHMKWFFDNGYITNRDGNIVTRYDIPSLPSVAFIQTKSGVDKAQMTGDDLILVNHGGDALPGYSGHPSIETKAHVQALDHTGKSCSIHVHSPKTTALFTAFGSKTGELEIHLNNDWPELFRYTRIGKTVDQLIPGSDFLHKAVGDQFKIKGVDAIVLKGHGVFQVGDSLDQCKEHIIRLEHISGIVTEMIKIEQALKA